MTGKERDKELREVEMRSLIGTACEQCAKRGNAFVFELKTIRKRNAVTIGKKRVKWSGNDTYLFCPGCQYHVQITSSLREGWGRAHRRIWENAFFKDAGMTSAELKTARIACRKAMRAVAGRNNESARESFIGFLIG